jgi:8-oxo-dGTP pyrophosphatase MutT (NUDIX family)
MSDAGQQKPGQPGGGAALVQPRAAASVILLRDTGGGPEVFMVERHLSAKFVGGAHVFPGGRVDPDDAEAEDLCAALDGRGLDDREASRRLHLERNGLAYYVAAIRECFEEAGVLLAYDRGGRLLDAGDERTAAMLEESRRALNAGEIGFLDLARRDGFRLAVDRMHYWAHWITPEQSPIRFDTRFFLATVPSHQAAVHHAAELAGSEWIRPAAALGKAERGEWTMILPTLRNLATIAGFSSIAEAEEAGRRRREIATQKPRILRRPEGIQVVLPGDDGWEEAAGEAAPRPQSAGDAGSGTDDSGEASR